MNEYQLYNAHSENGSKKKKINQNTDTMIYIMLDHTYYIFLLFGFIVVFN